MSTPHPAVSGRGTTRGWSATDLTPDDVRPLLDRFSRMFVPGADDECWPWTGSKLPSGYGQIRRSSYYAQPNLLAHRVSWVAFTGQSLTNQLTIDHLCFNKLCVNPSHLEPVPLEENLRRMRAYYKANPSARRRSTRPAAPRKPMSESTKQRNRERALAYYRENLDHCREQRRIRASLRKECPSCGGDFRADTLQRHIKRVHGDA